MGTNYASSRTAPKKRTVENLQGTSRKGFKTTAKAPARAENEPNPPPHMSATEKVVWEHVKKVLRERDQFSADNELAILGLVSSAAELIDCRRVVNEEGRTYRVLSTAATRSLRPGELQEIEFGPEHYLTKLRPEVHLMGQADRRLRAWLCEFGLTDATRVRVTKPSRDEEVDEVLGQYGLN